MQSHSNSQLTAKFTIVLFDAYDEKHISSVKGPPVFEFRFKISYVMKCNVRIFLIYIIDLSMLMNIKGGIREK